MDRVAIYFFYLFLVGAAVAILMSMHYLEVERESHGEFYALILFSVVGMMCMACGFDLVLLFIGLELMALSTYVLVGFLRRDKRSNEAALKYLLLGAFSSGIFAYGLSLLYGLVGFHQSCRNRHRACRSRIATHPRDPVIILALDHDRDRPAVQDRSRSIPSVGARRLRRSANQRYRVHVGGSEGRGMGDAVAHLPVCALSAAAHVHSAADLCLDRDHDRR